MGSGDEVEATKTNGARVSVRLGIDVGKMGRNVCIEVENKWARL